MNRLLLLSIMSLLLVGFNAHLSASACAASTAKEEVMNHGDMQNSDKILTDNIKAAFSADLTLAAQHVDFKVDKGVVTLSGYTDSAKAKDGFEAKAKSVSGVKNVVNNIEVKSSATK